MLLELDDPEELDLLVEELDDPEVPLDELDLPAEDGAEVVEAPGVELVVVDAVGEVVVVEKLGVLDLECLDALLCVVGVVLELHAAATRATAATASSTCQARLFVRFTGDISVAAGFDVLVTYLLLCRLLVDRVRSTCSSWRTSARA